MEVLILGIYSFFVWLIFIKFKWLPWNIGTQVTVVIIPIVGLTVLILLLNVVAPSSSVFFVPTSNASTNSGLKVSGCVALLGEFDVSPPKLATGITPGGLAPPPL